MGKKFYRSMLFVFKPIFAVIMPTKVVFRDRICKEKTFDVCNHLSVIDPFVLAIKTAPSEFHILAKKEVFKHKLGGAFLKGLGAIPIERGTNDMKSIREVFSLNKEGKTVTIFPEGTRNKTPDECFMLPLKKGTSMFAIKTKTPIQTYILYKKPRLFRKNYIFVGEPYTLEDYYFDRSPDAFDRANDVIAAKFDELKREADEYLAKKKKHGN